MSFPKVGSCPMCGAPIYNKPVISADSENMEKEPVFDVVRDDDGLPKNFFTCRCGLPKLIVPGGESDLSEVDMDRVHEKHPLSKTFRMSDEFIAMVDDDCPSKSMLRRFRDKYREKMEEKLANSLKAMERLQELVGSEGEISFCRVAPDTTDGRVIIRFRRYGDSGFSLRRDYETIPEAILNLKVEK